MARHSQPQNSMSNNVTVLAVSCTAPWPPDFGEAVVSRFPEHVRCDVQRYRKPKDRALRYTARMLLLHGITKLIGLSDSSLECWTVDRNGRPFLERVGVDFNISHAGEVAVCAITTKGRVGVDVELLRTLALKEFAFLFTETEMSIVYSSPTPSVEFLRLWTMKEALLKAEGRGFSKASPGLPELKAKLDCQLTPVEVGPDYFCYVAANPSAAMTIYRMQLGAAGEIYGTDET